jgi:broad specificity phosphatase PhoE
MPTLYLVRHGQAGFGQEEYDVLSTLGATQAQGLGRYFVMAQRPIDRLWSAPRRRHRATCDSLCLGMQAAGQDTGGLWSPGGPADASLVHDFDEFPFAEILATTCGPGGCLATEYSALLQELGGRNPLHDGRAFGRLFRMAMPRWAQGEVQVSESFVGFCARIDGALRRVARQVAELPSGHGAVVVTSAGAIAAALRSLLGVDAQTLLALCLALYNTGVTELRVRKVGEEAAASEIELSLISMNSVPHLLEPSHRTFR